MNKSLRVLSSDDDECIRTLLFGLLSEEGHVVEFARNSDDVFRNLGRARYDLVILDVNTPGMNGYQVAEKICSVMVDRPKLMIFTGRDIVAENFQFISSGADAVLQKGAPADKILATIQGLFDEPARPEPAPLPIPEPEPCPPAIQLPPETPAAAARNVP